MSPRKLISSFQSPDEDVFTLYDNWETAVARYPHVGQWMMINNQEGFIHCRQQLCTCA